MRRWLGIDHGTKRIGLAVADEDQAIAGPVGVIAAAPLPQAFEQIAAAAREYEVVGVVVGWPLNMDDSEGPQALLARAFAAELAQETGLDVRLWDERLSSADADSKLAGLYTRKQKRARHDAIAAATLLRDFLAAGGPAKAPTPQDAKPPK
jgi:putative holliday junction resolvase